MAEIAFCNRRIGIVLLLLLIGFVSGRGCLTAVAGQSGKRPLLQTGLAAFYGHGFQGARTASGEIFNKNMLVAAHPSLPLGSLVRVTNLANGRSIIVRINDRGPAPSQRARGVIIDLSRAAAEQLDFIKNGKTRVKLNVVRLAGNSQ